MQWNTLPTKLQRELFDNASSVRDSGVPAMPTAKEYRQQAKECLDLAKAAKDLYAKEAMTELAEEFSKTAELLEHPRG
jgi:hypothetical protein